VCNRHHSVDQQLCRLAAFEHGSLALERTEHDQELIANMLGVRREGVTEAAHKLQAAGLIKYSRGKITVLDRPRLKHGSVNATAVVETRIRPPASRNQRT